MTQIKARDVVDTNEYPIHKMSTGAAGEDGQLVSKNDPMPIEEAPSSLSVSLLSDMIMELKILNQHMSIITNDVITRHDIDDGDH